MAEILRFVRINNKASAPVFCSAGAAGADLCSAEDCVIPAKGKCLVSTGLQIALPNGHYGRVAPRSGLASKHFIGVGAGVIDEDYRGELKVLLFNFGDADFKVNVGDRIAQLVCERFSRPAIVEANNLDGTERGTNGFGTTDSGGVSTSINGGDVGSMWRTAAVTNGGATKRQLLSKDQQLGESAMEMTNRNDGGQQSAATGEEGERNDEDDIPSVYTWDDIPKPAEFDVLVTDINEAELQKLGKLKDKEHLSPGVFLTRAFPVDGVIYGPNLRFMACLVCRLARKSDAPTLNVWFLVQTASPYTFLTEKSWNALFGGAGNMTDDQYYVSIQEQSSQIVCKTSHGRFKEVNILGADAILKLGVSINVVDWDNFKLTNQ